jgi:hypothetical protein
MLGSMKATWYPNRGGAVIALVVGLASFGCDGDSSGRPERVQPAKVVTPVTRSTANEVKESDASPAPEDELAPRDAPVVDDTPPTPGAKSLGKGLFFERDPKTDKRRVFVTAWVCLREGSYGLECLMCRKGTKEHESILATDADARLIHAALEAAKAKAGSPVQYDPKFKSPTGTPIKVTLQYTQKGKTISAPAQQWVRNVKSKKELDQNWVFAGSRFFKDPDEPKKEPVYLAREEGAYICVTNVPTAMLDLPIESSKALENREFAPYTERIPELETKVVVILEPIPEQKKK